MENEFNLSISLDGPRNYHDRNRHRIDDSGSFDIVMQILKDYINDILRKR